MTLNRDGPAACELPNNIRSNLIAIVRDLFKSSLISYPVNYYRCPIRSKPSPMMAECPVCDLGGVLTKDRLTRTGSQGVVAGVLVATLC
jgi:hypothetical protein